MKEIIYRAGIIPYYFTEQNDLKMLFMKPSDPEFGGEEFQIAKGKIDPGESEKQAAIREGQEELGLFKHNINKLHNLGVFLGRTTIFIAEIENPELFGDPHFETESVKWMTPKEFNDEVD